MKVLLIKPETLGIFAMTNMVEHEPLELEYLYTVLTSKGYEAILYDRRHDLTSLRKKLKQTKPDVVCITGYINQQGLMFRLIHEVKSSDSNIVVVAGGSQVELNYENFYSSEADYLYHISGLNQFGRLMDYIDGKEVSIEDIKGVCYVHDGKWIYNDKLVETPADLPVPDRTYFYEHQNKYRYLPFRPLALVKNSFSCPNSCRFCFCTNRNSGVYQCRSVVQLVDEIASIQVPNIHITDDNFLTNEDYLRNFIKELKRREINKKFLVYGRADFVATHEELIKEFAQVGLALVMVGLESFNDADLEAYNKNTLAWHNEECVRILEQNQIICAGLFIVHQDMTKKDFKQLYQWIAKRAIIPTVSIYTPMQGASNYEEYKEQLLTKDVNKQDLYHCLLKPKHMSVLGFLMEYYKLSMALAFKNRKSVLYSCVGITDLLVPIKVFFIKIKRLFAF